MFGAGFDTDRHRSGSQLPTDTKERGADFAGQPWGLSMAISGDFRVATDTIRARLGRARMVDEPSEVPRASSKVDCGVKTNPSKNRLTAFPQVGRL